MRKNTYIFFIIFVLLLFLSVGYAVVNSLSLTVTGSAAGNTYDLNTFFTGDTTKSTTGNAIITTGVSAGTRNATVSISNMVLNETVTVKYKIANEEVDVASLVAVNFVNNSNPTYFSVTARLSINSSMCFSSSYYGDYNYLILTVKMIKTPVKESDSSTDISVGITATPTYDHNCPV